MNKDERLKLNDRVLVLTLFVQALFLVNQLFTLGVYAGQSFQSSIVPTEGGETLQVHIQTDTGRPRGILDQLTRYLQSQTWLTSSWLGAWMVNGVERSDATVAITITVTGSNVQSTATLNFYIEGRPAGGSGQPYRFVDYTSEQATVGGSPVSKSFVSSIPNHLTQMGLTTDQSWTVDYYVYAKAEATGAVSGEPLTSEITEIKFDTKTYELYDPGTWTQIPVMKSTGYVGYARHETQSVTLLDSADLGPSVPFGERAPAYTARQYTAWLCFQNSRAEDSGYGSVMLPYVTPGTLVIHEAYLKMQAKTATPAQRVTVHLRDSTSWVSTDADTYAKWTNVWGQRLPVNATWNAPYFYDLSFYNTTDIGPVVQALVDKRSIPGSGRMVFYLANDGDAKSTWKTAYAWYSGYDQWDRWVTLYIRWSQYTASWYPQPPMSLASLPITLDVVALAVLIAATVYAARETKRGKDVWYAYLLAALTLLALVRYVTFGALEASWYPIPPLSVTLPHVFGGDPLPWISYVALGGIALAAYIVWRKMK